jgi:hypothetical protein
VLVEALDDEFVAAHQAEYEAADDDAELETEDEVRTSFTQDESELIAKRLQALGYIK